MRFTSVSVVIGVDKLMENRDTNFSVCRLTDNGSIPIGEKFLKVIIRSVISKRRE
jgi:hypothetical protein